MIVLAIFLAVAVFAIVLVLACFSLEERNMHPPDDDDDPEYENFPEGDDYR